MVNFDNICGAEGVGKISCLFKNRVEGWLEKQFIEECFFFYPLITKVKESAVI